PPAKALLTAGLSCLGRQLVPGEGNTRGNARHAPTSTRDRREGAGTKPVPVWILLLRLVDQTPARRPDVRSTVGSAAPLLDVSGRHRNGGRSLRRPRGGRPRLRGSCARLASAWSNAPARAPASSLRSGSRLTSTPTPCNEPVTHAWPPRTASGHCRPPAG